MKISFLGSAAAEAVPALWCECDTCRQAKINGGKDIRQRTSYLIDDDTLVDFGPDAFRQSIAFNLEWGKIRRILVTHAHEDHINTVELLWRQDGFSRVGSKLKMFATARVFSRISAETGVTFEKLKIDPVEIKPGDRVTDGSLQFLAIRAHHEENDGQAVNYIITRHGRSVLIANDTGWWDDDAWEQVSSLRVDAAIIECTMGMNPPYINHRQGHLGANVSVEFRDRLMELGVINSDTPVIVNHFSHNGRPLHKNLCDFFNPRNIQVGYDGMALELFN